MSRSSGDLPVNWYEDLLGLEYAQRSERVEEGIDCLGLVKEVYRRLGIALDMPEFDYSDGWEERTRPFILAVVANGWRRIPRPTRPGDIVLMRPPDGRTHVGVMVSRTMLLHTTDETGVCAMRANRPGVIGLIEGVYRHVGDR